MRKDSNPRTYLVPIRASNWSKGRIRLRMRAMIPPMEKLVDMTMMRESLNPTQIQQPTKPSMVNLSLEVPVVGEFDFSIPECRKKDFDCC